MPPGGTEASSVAGHVIAVNEAEIELGLRAELQHGRRCEIGVTDRAISSAIASAPLKRL